MLTEGVEDASTAMYELKFMFGLKGTLPQFPAAGRGFQNTPCPAVRILSMPSYAAVLCLVTQRSSPYSVKFCNRSAVSGHDFQNIPCPVVTYF